MVGWKKVSKDAEVLSKVPTTPWDHNHDCDLDRSSNLNLVATQYQHKSEYSIASGLGTAKMNKEGQF